METEGRPVSALARARVIGPLGGLVGLDGVSSVSGATSFIFEFVESPAAYFKRDDNMTSSLLMFDSLYILNFI